MLGSRHLAARLNPHRHGRYGTKQVMANTLDTLTTNHLLLRNPPSHPLAVLAERETPRHGGEHLKDCRPVFYVISAVVIGGSTLI